MSATPKPLDDGLAMVELAKRGDVILVLNKDPEVATKLLVSSAFLSQASMVFENMFDGRFAEGQALSSTNPREVPLPDDDPVCMLMLCRIIHMHTSEVPRQLNLDALDNFATLSDKHRCIDVVRSFCRVWVMELLPQTNLEGYEKLLRISYALDLADEFYKVTQNIIRYRTFSFDFGAAANGVSPPPIVFNKTAFAIFSIFLC